MGDDDVQTLVLEGELGLRDAPALVHTLAAAMAQGGAALDCAALVSLDAAVLQVLIAGHRAATEAAVPFGFIDPDHSVLRTALVGHGMVAGDGSPLTPEHDFWTRPLSPGASTSFPSEAA